MEEHYIKDVGKITYVYDVNLEEHKMVIEKQQKRIAELEQELKEKDNYHLRYELAGADETIANLRQQLEEKDKEINSLIIDYEKRISQEQELMSNLEKQLAEKQNTIDEINKELEKLKQQLVEKEKELAYITKQAKKFNNEAQKYYEDAYCNSFQNQKAIVELEKVKNFVDGRTYCADYINKRIQDLKGE